jgi:hypothetical protein
VSTKLTDDQIRAIVAWSRKGRQNSHKRTIRRDAAAALDGHAPSREAMADHVRFYAHSFGIDAELGAKIAAYLDTDWSDGRDPSKFGALNAVSYIGERIAAIYAARRAEILNAREEGE